MEAIHQLLPGFALCLNRLYYQSHLIYFILLIMRLRNCLQAGVKQITEPYFCRYLKLRESISK